MSVEVLLNETEMDYALFCAAARIEKSKGYSLDTEHLAPEVRLKAFALGASAELAAAKWLKVPNFRLSIDTYKSEPDIWPNWEVKHTVFDYGNLIIQQNDRDTDRAILVTGLNPFVIRGWLPINYCKDSLYLKTTSRNTAYWVPQNELVKVG